MTAITTEEAASSSESRGDQCGAQVQLKRFLAVLRRAELPLSKRKKDREARECP